MENLYAYVKKLKTVFCHTYSFTEKNDFGSQKALEDFLNSIGIWNKDWSVHCEKPTIPKHGLWFYQNVHTQCTHKGYIHIIDNRTNEKV